MVFSTGDELAAHASVKEVPCWKIISLSCERLGSGECALETGDTLVSRAASTTTCSETGLVKRIVVFRPNVNSFLCNCHRTLCDLQPCASSSKAWLHHDLTKQIKDNLVCTCTVEAAKRGRGWLCRAGYLVDSAVHCICTGFSFAESRYLLLSRERCQYAMMHRLFISGCAMAAGGCGL